MPSAMNNAAILEAVQTYGASKSYSEIAAMLGLPVSVVGTLARNAGLKKPYVTVGYRSRQLRALEVISTHAQTHTLQQMGQMLGLTRERVRQLCVKWQIKRNPIYCSRALRHLSDSELRQRVRQRDKSLTKIAEELRLGVESLKKELNRRGITPRTKNDIAAWLLKRGKLKCCRCQKIKRVEKFYRSHKDVYTSDCRDCRSIDCKARWERNEVVRRNLPTSTWEGMFEVFKLFHQKHGHCNVPFSPNPGSLSRWLGRQRLDFRAGKLLLERKALLESLGFDPSQLTQKEQDRRAAQEAHWEARLKQFTDFRAQHGHLPGRFGPEARLRTWWYGQVTLLNRGLMKPERVHRLREKGITITRRAQTFDSTKPIQVVKSSSGALPTASSIQ